MVVFYPSPLVHVEQFHLIYGQAIRVTPHMDIPERLLRVELIREEVNELFTAARDNDFIEVVDAVADILYVTYGAALAHGINPDFNMGLIDHSSPAQNVHKTLLLEKATLPVKPHLSSIALARELPHVAAAFTEYETASNNLNHKALSDAISKLVFTCYSLALRLGVNIDDVLAEVQRSNLSKLGADGKPVYRESDGKVLKGPNFFTPDITKILTQQGWNPADQQKLPGRK